MMKNFKGSLRAKRLLNDIGFDEITHLPMNKFVAGLGATLVEEELENSDGKIVKGKSKTLIKINSNIPYESKKRFTIAHEVGHFLLHERIEVHNENSNTLNWFQNTENQLKRGIQEWEANDFAAELLMPEQIFREEAYGKCFSHEVVKYLSDRFKTSITSTIFRFMKLDLHPMLVVFINNGEVKYWDKSSSWKYWIKDITKLSPPEESVAREYIDANYEFLYSGNEKTQQIFKSTWCKLNYDEKDVQFYEYCIPTKQYKTIISVIWEQ
jgi:Zn-dependent peptidase ImmA (M78 family)